MKSKIPVLVGVAQSVHREKTTEQVGPIEMMADVGLGAGRDASLDDLSKVDTLYVINCISRNLEAPALRTNLGRSTSINAHMASPGPCSSGNKGYRPRQSLRFPSAAWFPRRSSRGNQT